MASSFNYGETDTPSDAVSSVADAIRASHRLAPLTDQQKLERRIKQEIAREEQAWREEQRRAERERQEQEREAIARHEASVALAEANRQARLERSERINRDVREREIRDLQLKSATQQGWMNSVENSARVGQYLRQRQAIMDEMDGIINPPPPVPERIPEPESAPEYPPAPKVGDEDFWEKWNARGPLRSWYPWLY